MARQQAQGQNATSDASAKGGKNVEPEPARTLKV